MIETTVKQTRGVRSESYKIAFVNALKAVDAMKDKEARQRLMVRAVMDWMAEDCEENNGSKTSKTDVQ